MPLFNAVPAETHLRFTVIRPSLVSKGKCLRSVILFIRQTVAEQTAWSWGGKGGKLFMIKILFFQKQMDLSFLQLALCISERSLFLSFMSILAVPGCLN